jgi:ABC-type Fe3+ transport system substrate-binding protein
MSANRAQRRGLAACVLAAMLLTACQAPAASVSAPAAVAPAAVAPAPPAAAPPSAVPPSAAWDSLVADAKREGTVRLALPPGIPGLGDVFARTFGEEFGIRVDSAPDQHTAYTRIEQEAASGKVSIDVQFGGANELLNLYPEGLLDPIAAKLVYPEVTDLSLWRDGRLKWADNAQDYLFVTGQWVHIDLMVNAQVVDPRAITSWQDLLKPEYRGKIIAQDVHVGAGGATARALLESFGPDYIKALYLDQGTTVTRDAREVVQELARGTRPIALAVLPQQAEEFRKQGFRLERVFPNDGIVSVSGGQGTVKLVKNGPNPNAAALFINWYASKRGQEQYSRQSLEASRRLDVNVPEVPDYVKPKPGVEYRDHYQEDYYMNIAPAMLKQLDELLGR